MLSLGSAACSEAEDEDPGAASGSASPFPSASPTALEPTPAELAWQDNFTSAQLDAYNDALAQFESYETRTEPIWAQGKVTSRAEALFKQYFPSPIWQGYLRRLRTYQQVDVQIDGLADIYWSKAKSISAGGRSVVVEQCVDYTTISTTQRGSQAEPVDWQLLPNLRTINLEQPGGNDWLIYGIEDATSGKARPCTP
jgi:hypothetical protein